jgi:hypothetical protein
MNANTRILCLGVVSVVLAGVVPPSVSSLHAQTMAGLTRVEYDVEFRVVGSLLDANCAASGTDVLTGTLIGFEPARPSRNDAISYVGTMVRQTSIGTCGERMDAAGVGHACNMTITGSGLAEVMLTIDAGRRDAYLEYLDNRAMYVTILSSIRQPIVPVTSTVTGTCDPAETGPMQATYHKGQTGGSPNGQPIELPGFPPLSQPITSPLVYPPNPPQSIWSLTVNARRP